VLGLCLAAALAVAGALTGGRAALADGVPGQAAVDVPTRFQRFVLTTCGSCVRESHQIARVSIPSFIPTFPRVVFRQTTRPGPVEIVVDVLRAYPLGQPSRQTLALRTSSWVVSGPAGPQYLLAEGIVDEEEVGALVATVNEISRIASSRPSGGDETVDVDFRGGSLRVGVIRLRSDALAYVQGGDIASLAFRAVWDVPTTAYLPGAELTSLGKAFGDAAAKIQSLRSGR
jgi:hypothetical protein